MIKLINMRLKELINFIDMYMKKTLFFALVVAYIITAFGLGDGFEMNLIPFNWDIFLLIKFAIFFILTVICLLYTSPSPRD